MKSSPEGDLVSALEFLATRGWLSSRSESFKARLGSVASLLDFAAGEALYRVGDPSSGLFGLVSGSLRISVPRDDGEDYAFHRAEPGFWVGDAAVLSDSLRLVTVFAAEPCRLVFIATKALEQLVQDEPRLYRDFYALTHLNFSIALRLMVNNLTPASDRRLALRLLQQDELAGHSAAGVAVTQHELAELIGVSTPTLQRALKRLVDRGLVEVGYARIRICDRNRLLQYCTD